MEDFKKVEEIVGHSYKDKNLLKNAFIHSSYANEHKVRSNERLEFLGDSVLSVIVTDEIYHKYRKNEGDLSKIRASLVSEKSLSFIFDGLGLTKFLLCGEAFKNKAPTVAMQADAMEALIASLYLDAGLEKAREFVLSVMSESLKGISTHGVPDSYKSLLQEKFKNAKIVYQFSTVGEGEEKTYTSKVFINGVMSGIGVSSKKREAEEIAAQKALESVKKI